MVSELVPDELYFSRTHEWVQLDENVATIGLTAQRLNELGEVLYLDLPEDGEIVRQGETSFTIESVKQIHDFFSPVSGIILEVNSGLQEDPGVLNDSPFGDGWILKVEMDKETELMALLRSAEYKTLIRKRSMPESPELGEPAAIGP